MNIRAGKDVALQWTVLTDGQEEPLSGRDLKLYMQTPDGREEEIVKTADPAETEKASFYVSGTSIIINLYGKDLAVTGMYSLTLWENKGKRGQKAVDFLNAFRLVGNTGLEDDETEGSNLQEGVVEIGKSKL